MRTVGIIAEYDPFHCGHAYQMQEARRRAEADYVVCAMSPDFLQRGEPALIDKWVRARMALEAGADLVLELPVRCAVGSAEYFAQGAVRLLDSLGCVDTLSFGCESADDFSILEQAALFFAKEETEEYRGILRGMLREGVSYPKARAQAFARVLCGEAHGSGAAYRSGTDYRSGAAYRSSEVISALSRPNNILAIEYRKAAIRLHSSMQMLPVRRLGSYHTSPDGGGCSGADCSGMDCSGASAPGAECLPGAGMEDSGFASASAIRLALAAQGMELSADLEKQLPASTVRLLEEELRQGRYAVSGDLDLLLHRELIRQQDMLETYVDIDEELANRIRGCLRGYTGFVQFAMLVQSKQYTLSRIRRSLLHVLLGIRKEETAPASPCARVLGFRKRAKPLLHRIREQGCVPLSTGLPFQALSPEDIDAAHLWEMILTNRTHRPLRHERQRALVLLD